MLYMHTHKHTNRYNIAKSKQKYKYKIGALANANDKKKIARHKTTIASHNRQNNSQPLNIRETTIDKCTKTDVNCSKQHSSCVQQTKSTSAKNQSSCAKIKTGVHSSTIETITPIRQSALHHKSFDTIDNQSEMFQTRLSSTLRAKRRAAHDDWSRDAARQTIETASFPR
jgi:hypothetical protein